MKVKKILVVDNNPTIVELVSAYLESDGYEVMKAYDGIDALDRLEETEILPEVIILDLVMPKIDGQRLTRILKLDERYAEIPIIILSGIAAEEDGKLLAFGADAYIAKGKIDETFAHIKKTVEWLEDRSVATEKKEEILGLSNIFPREMTRELLLVKQHFDSMFRLMQEGVIEIDQDNRILFANPAAQRLLCQEDHHLFGSNIQELFDDSEKLKSYLEELPGKSEDHTESLQLSCDNFVTRAIATPFFLEGKYIGAIVILQDITSIVHREKTLEDLMAAVVRNAPIGLCLLDAAGGILVANRALAVILGHSGDWEAQGVNIFDFLADVSPHLTDAIRQGLALAPGKNVDHKAEYFPEGSDGRKVLNVTVVALEVTGEEKLLLMVEDVTEKATLEENLLRANEEMEKANRSKSTFLSMVSHELRTPLSVVRGYISLILEGKIGPGEEEVRGALQVADKRARHLQHLIEELLDLSRIEAGTLSIRKESLDVAKHLRETLDMFRDDQEQKHLVMEVEIPDDLPTVIADHDKIHQVYTNLVSNAIKFSNEGGSVAVKVKKVGGRVEFVISDSGIGIPTDRLDKIFNKFYQVDSSDTRKHSGTGLGLSIVKMILTALGGTIHVTSELGKGTTFTFTLPVGDEIQALAVEKPEEKAAVQESEEATVSKRILIIEDDPDTREMIRIFLSDKEFDVILCDNAFEGLKELYRRQPDLVLADALLPLMSGLDLCRIIKNHPELKEVPVVMLSAAAQENEIRNGYEVGADSYLVKPFASQDLLETIHKFAN